MRKTFTVFLPLVLSLLHGLTLFTTAGTWSDGFSESALGQEWHGDTNFFSIIDGALKGVSASPLAPVPLHLVEVGNGWSNYVVQCRINVVTPNLLVCTKGALILRHGGNEGYVFALHVATKAVEVYRLSDHEMLLSKDQPLELKKWYEVRAELQGEKMTFFVDDQLIGTVTDTRSPSGALGLAVQDTLETLFDDFSVTGPTIPGNGLEAVQSGEKITLTWPAAFTNEVLKTTVALFPSATWTTITNSPVANGDHLSVSLSLSPGNRFFKLAPVAQ
jgi:hypothetical protein